MWIFAALIVVPIIEIALFIKVGGFIGLWPTIALVIVTAVLGAILLRAQGFAAVRRLQASVDQGGDPRGPLAHGVMILLAGFLMLTPGFFTDTIGFLLLLPPVRDALIGWAGPRLAARTVFVDPRGRGAGRPDPSRDGSAINVEYEDLTDHGEDRTDDHGGRGESGWTRPPR